MEKIRVNMTPCEEVKTIHASQNDNATRKWAFDLYDENGKIDSSSIKEQMIFDSRVGGTEQILPENTSDPTTSSIIADIQYPDSLRSEQTFLYRESPTSEDGQAKITHIKGNTLVWNQLAKPRTPQSGTACGLTLTNNNNGSYTISGTFNNTGDRNFYGFVEIGTVTQGHKYLISSSGSLMGYFVYGNATGNRDATKYITTATATGILDGAIRLIDSKANNGQVVNETIWINVFDLTQMGLDTLTADQFTSLYPLPYYSYTTDKLLPFKGEELKTTGFNQFDEVWELGYYNIDTGLPASSPDWQRSKNGIPCFGNTAYCIVRNSTDSVGYGSVLFYDGNNSYISRIALGSDILISSGGQVITTPSNARRMQVFRRIANDGIGACFSISATRNGKYEPYTSSTINLSVLEHFPTGLKAVPDGNGGYICDEITESKAITRVGSYTFKGNETINASADLGTYYRIEIPYQTITPDMAISSQGYATIAISDFAPFDGGYTTDSLHFYYYNGSWRIYIPVSSDAEALSYLTGKSMYYELATPTEESITTASLVTEKGESPLYYDDDELIADCNETISSESGIFDAKIKLMDDNTIYSQKIQLHIERKPQ